MWPICFRRFQTQAYWSAALNLGFSVTPRHCPVSHSEGWDAAVSGCASWAPRQRNISAAQRLQSRHPEWQAGFSISRRLTTVWVKKNDNWKLLFVILVFLFMILAILNDQYDLATLLIRYSAKVDQVGPLNRTALHESAFLGLENFVHLLLESGANPNACDSKQKTPLALAAQNGHLNIVETLLEKGLQGLNNV